MPASTKSFEHRSIIHTTMQAIRNFHEDPKALTALTPPPLFVQIVRDERVSLTDGDVEFTLVRPRAGSLGSPARAGNHCHVIC